MAVCCFLLFFSESKSQLLCRRIFRRASSFQRKFSIGSILCSTWIISVAQFSIRLVFQTATSRRELFQEQYYFAVPSDYFLRKVWVKFSEAKISMSLFFFGENRPSVQFFVGRIFLGFIQRGSYPEGIVSAGQFLSSYQTHII